MKKGLIFFGQNLKISGHSGMGRNSIFGNVIYCAVLVTDKNLLQNDYLQNRPKQFKIRTFYLDQIDKYNLKRSTNEILKWFSI